MTIYHDFVNKHIPLEIVTECLIGNTKNELCAAEICHCHTKRRTGRWEPFVCDDADYIIFIDREAGEIIRLVASVRPSVCPSVCPSVRQDP